MPWPTPGACDETNLQVKTETRTLNPGTYCGGLDVFNSSNVTFTPGTYIIKDGPFKVQTHSAVAGQDVTFILMGNNTSIFLQAGTTVALDAPQTGDFAGIVFAQEPTSNPGGESEIQGGSGMDIVGTIYLPTQKLDLGGGGELALTSSHVPLVAFQVDVRGDNLSLTIDEDLFPGEGLVSKVNEVVHLIE